MPTLLLGLLPILTDVLSRVLPDPQAQQKAIADIVAQVNSSDLAQLEVNKAEAANRSLFVAGWRPFIGWVCGFALAYTYVIMPIGMWVVGFFGEKYVTMLLNAPKLDGNLWELMFAMLGMAGLRSFDKFKGLSK
jgi:hypothetical protein